VFAIASSSNSRRVGTDEPICGTCAMLVRLTIDTDRLTLVLVNLIENAVKHGRPGGDVFVGVEVVDRRFVRVTVEDDGPAIATADLERAGASTSKPLCWAARDLSSSSRESDEDNGIHHDAAVVGAVFLTRRACLAVPTI
jgi:Histidine kinase-, DNA gyrase B-, and HSP90-like ATPase